MSSNKTSTEAGTWRLSWRATGAWIAAALIAGALYGASAAVLDAWASEQTNVLQEAWQLSLLLAVGLLVLGGMLLLVVSFLGRFSWWFRPWMEMILGAVGFYFLITHQGFLTLTIDSAAGEVAPHQHPAAFILAYVAPPLVGAAMPLVYWLLSRRAP